MKHYLPRKESQTLPAYLLQYDLFSGVLLHHQPTEKSSSSCQKYKQLITIVISCLLCYFQIRRQEQVTWYLGIGKAKKSHAWSWGSARSSTSTCSAVLIWLSVVTPQSFPGKQLQNSSILPLEVATSPTFFHLLHDTVYRWLAFIALWR